MRLAASQAPARAPQPPPPEVAVVRSRAKRWAIVGDKKGLIRADGDPRLVQVCVTKHARAGGKRITAKNRTAGQRVESELPVRARVNTASIGGERRCVEATESMDKIHFKLSEEKFEVSIYGQGTIAMAESFPL